MTTQTLLLVGVAVGRPAGSAWGLCDSLETVDRRNQLARAVSRETLEADRGEKVVVGSSAGPKRRRQTPRLPTPAEEMPTGSWLTEPAGVTVCP